ncbi:MAG: hypothetical protein HYV27_22835 [Candidatus Hydrogenedentes bacterium]|nr:hypothetical protein [Candidatus Hydrogenedentota bacterium]
MASMTPNDFWNEYAGAMNPADFILQFQSRNPRRCAEHHVRAIGSFLGIVHRGSWTKTFAAEYQHLREEVICGITAHLEACRDSWEEAVRNADSAASRTVIEDETPPVEDASEDLPVVEQGAMSDEELEQYYREEFGASDRGPAPEGG